MFRVQIERSTGRRTPPRSVLRSVANRNQNREAKPMVRLWKMLSIVALMVALLPIYAAAQAVGAASKPFYFIHVPPTSSGAKVGDVVKGLQDIGKVIEDDWKGKNPGKTPKICWVGFAGRWFSTTGWRPNLSGAGVQVIGGASATDNHCAFSVPIAYCVAEKIRDDLTGATSKCDIVIWTGEGANPWFDMETHGDPNKPAIKDCLGQTPGIPVCKGNQCTGTNWTDPLMDGVISKYPKTNKYPVKKGTGAGCFLCGSVCCEDKSTQGCMEALQPICILEG